MRKKISMTQEQAALYRELKQLAKLSNQRIVRIERNFGYNTYVVQKLREKMESTPLKAWTEKGRVRVRKDFTEIQMRAIIKELKAFRSNLFTTKRGIKKAKKRGIESIKREFGTQVKDITFQEAEGLYYFFDDKEVSSITNFIPRF